MDVSAVAQVTQGQSAVASQDNGDTASTLFAYLLKHQFDNGQSGGSLINSQPMLDMVGAAPAYVPPPTPPAQPQATTSTSNNSQSQSNQSGNTSNSSTGSTSGQPVANVNSNGNGNSGSGAQSDSSDSNNRQSGSNSNSSNSGTQTSSSNSTSAPSRAPAATGADATTEATAAALAAPMVFVQQSTPVATTAAGPTLLEAADHAAHSGPAPTAAGSSAAPTATNATPTGAAAQAAAAAASDGDSAPEATPWSLNFLATASAASPQIAQQAAGLTQATGGANATVSVQTTSGNTVSSPSASALVPDAVLAISGFLGGGQQGASSGGGSGDQPTGQQTLGGPADTAQVDPDAELLAEDAQALMALTSTIQTVAQDLAANAAQPQTAGVSSAAAAPAAASLSESALPQPTTPSTQTANPSGFAAQLQDAEQTQAPQANRPIALASAVDQIKMQIEKGLAQGSSTIKVQLTPENMGRVEVKLEVQNGSVKATITADRADTLQVLKSDQNGLLQSLHDAGLNADSNSLSFFLRGDQQRQFAQSNRQGRGQGNGSAGEDDPLLAGITAASGASSATGTGNLDISV